MLVALGAELADFGDTYHFEYFAQADPQAILNRLRTAPGGLPVCQYHRETAVWALDHFQRVAAFRSGVFVDLGNRDLNFHTIILLWS